MNYHSQHAPLGAFASFTLGLPGARGGLGQSLSGPADQDIFIGYRNTSSQDAAWQMMPFYEKQAESASAAFTTEFAHDSKQSGPEPEMLPVDKIQRSLGWGSDAWVVGDFSFEVFSPLGQTASPETMSLEEGRRAFAPTVQAAIAYDNRAGSEAVELVFGLGNAQNPFRPLEDRSSDLIGFAMGQAMGFAARRSDVAWRKQALSVFGAENYQDHRGLHLLGKEAVLVFRVEAGEVKRFPISLGFYAAGNITTGLYGLLLHAAF